VTEQPTGAIAGSIHDVDAQRARWVRHRQFQGMMLDADRDDGEHMTQTGLGRYTNQLDARLLFLPGDPESDAVPLDHETLAWLKEPRGPSTGSYPSWGSQERATSNALVLYDQYREDRGWTRYLALHRHGGIEAGLGRLTYQIDDVRIFHLQSIVGAVWRAAAVQAEVAERWQVRGPFELTVAIPTSGGAALGGFGEGWASPGRGLWEFRRCIEDKLLLRLEGDEAFEPAQCARQVGDRLEQAFGTVMRRHLAHTGEYEGRLDPRF
jgi:hypothetical protein